MKKLNYIILALFMGCTTHLKIQPDDELGDTGTDSIDNTSEKVEYEEVNSEAVSHFLDGELLTLQGNYPLAILEFQDALLYDSNSTGILTSLAKAYIRLGKFKRAEKHLMEALSIDINNRMANELLGHQLLIHGQLEKAETIYQRLKEIYPETVKYRYILGELALRRGNSEASQMIYWNIYESSFRETKALEKAAKIAMERNDFPFALESYELLVKSKPNDLDSWNIFIELAVKLNFFNKAIDGLNQLLELTNDDPQVKEKLGILFIENDDMERGKTIFEELNNNDFKSAVVLYYLSEIALENKEYDKLISLSTESINKYPDELSGYTNQAISYLHLEKSLEAISVLLDARKRFPENYAVNYLLGTSYTEIKNYSLAEKSLKSAIYSEPDSRSAKHLLATVYNEMEEWNQLDSVYQSLIESDKSDSQALNNYSYMLAERGIDLKFALEMALRAVEVDPDNAAYYDTLGWIYYKMKNYNLAGNYIQKSLEIESNSPVVLEHMGDVLMEKDDLKGAINYFQKALEFDSGNRRLLEKLKPQEVE